MAEWRFPLAPDLWLRLVFEGRDFTQSDLALLRKYLDLMERALEEDEPAGATQKEETNGD